MARVLRPYELPKNDVQLRQVVRVVVHEDDTFTVPATALPGSVVVDQSGVYLMRVPTREMMVVKN